MFDRYVGLPYRRQGRDRAGLDCYGLVRLVLFELAGQDWPNYLEQDSDGATITNLASSLEVVKEPRKLDVSIIFVANKEVDKFVFRPIHLGIFCNAFQILHIEEHNFSRVQPAKELKIHSILRVVK